MAPYEKASTEITMNPAAQPIITIVGATATGKSDLALDLAQRLGGEIINSDSMQFYRGMDIGTAKVPQRERRGIPHHLLDILDVTEDADVKSYQSAARRLIVEIRERGKRPILVGGSGLYTRAATDVMEFPPTDSALRARIEAAVSADRWAKYRELITLDPVAANKITANDTRRIVRALEVIALTGRPFSAQLPEYEQVVPTIQLGLTADRPVLHSRIDQRVDSMWANGWVQEVVELLERGLANGRTASRAIGYGQITSYLAGDITRDDAQIATKTRTRQFARRQETWFMRDPRTNWIDSTSGDSKVNFENAMGLIAQFEGFA